VVGRADPRQHEQLREPKAPAARIDLALGADALACRAARSRKWTALARPPSSAMRWTAAPVTIRRLSRERTGRRYASFVLQRAPRALRDLDERCAVLLGAVVVGDDRDPAGLGRPQEPPVSGRGERSSATRSGPPTAWCSDAPRALSSARRK
jgi:hypothetical protein